MTDRTALLKQMAQAREIHDANQAALLEPLSDSELRDKLEEEGVSWAFGYIQGLYERIEGLDERIEALIEGEDEDADR